MRSFKDQTGATFAVAKGRESTKNRVDAAEVIDLIQLPSGSRPRPFVPLDIEEVERSRALDCTFYGECLSFAASAKWRGFSCRTCPRYAAAHPEESEADEGAAIASIIHLP